MGIKYVCTQCQASTIFSDGFCKKHRSHLTSNPGGPQLDVPIQGLTPPELHHFNSEEEQRLAALPSKDFQDELLEFAVKTPAREYLSSNKASEAYRLEIQRRYSDSPMGKILSEAGYLTSLVHSSNLIDMRDSMKETPAMAYIEAINSVFDVDPQNVDELAVAFQRIGEAAEYCGNPENKIRFAALREPEVAQAAASWTSIIQDPSGNESRFEEANQLREAFVAKSKEASVYNLEELLGAS